MGSAWTNLADLPVDSTFTTATFGGRTRTHGYLATLRVGAVAARLMFDFAAAAEGLAALVEDRVARLAGFLGVPLNASRR
jgi:hypothetical protein